MRHLFLPWILIACGNTPQPALAPDGGPVPSRVPPGPDTPDAILDEVAAIHGGAGPFAVAGYRMARHALKTLDRPPTGFSVQVVHHSPAAVQYSCVADGWQAATRASVGKGTLAWREAALADFRTEVASADQGARLTYRLTPDFLDRYTDLPRDALREAGHAVAQLPDDAIFTASPPTTTTPTAMERVGE